jgi:hypothetical protein
MLVDILLSCGTDDPADLLPLSSSVSLVLGGEYRTQFQLDSASVTGADAKALQDKAEAAAVEEDEFVLKGAVSFFEDSHAPWIIHLNVASLYCALGF